MRKLSQLQAGDCFHFPSPSQGPSIQFLRYDAYHGYQLRDLSTGSQWWSWNDRTVIVEKAEEVSHG